AREPVIDRSTADTYELTRLHDRNRFAFHLGLASVDVYRWVVGGGLELTKLFLTATFELSRQILGDAVSAVKSILSGDASSPTIAARPIASAASSVLAPMCGVARKLGMRSSSSSSGGSLANTSNAAPAQRS